MISLGVAGKKFLHCSREDAQSSHHLVGDSSRLFNKLCQKNGDLRIEPIDYAQGKERKRSNLLDTLLPN